MAATTMNEARPKPRPAGFANTLASEWTKLISVRSTYIMLALGFGLSVGMTALVSLVVGMTFDEWGPADQAQFEPIMFSLVGIIFAFIVFSVFGVMAVSGEYSSGMIRLTLSATPKRWRVLAAKMLLVALLTASFGLLTTLAMFFAGQAVLGSYGMPTAGFGDDGVQRAVLGVGATMFFFPVIGTALGFLLRSTAGGITAVLAILWLPEIFGGLLPMWWRENVLSRLPGAAIDSVTISHIVDSPTYSDPAVGAAVALGWLVLFVGAAYIALRRRDA